jgi:hypothetical protein
MIPRLCTTNVVLSAINTVEGLTSCALLIELSVSFNNMKGKFPSLANISRDTLCPDLPMMHASRPLKVTPEFLELYASVVHTLNDLLGRRMSSSFAFPRNF